MSDPVLAKAEKCLSAGTPSRLRANASRFRYIVPSTINGNGSTTKSLPLGVMRCVDLVATVPTTRQGAIALINAFLLCQEADMDRTQCSELLARLKAFLQRAA